MIRIRNISRENRKLRRKDKTIHLATGGYVRVMHRREVVIDYSTYLKNRAIICLPDEPYDEQTNFLVVAGVQEILSKAGSTLKEEEPVMPTTITQPPKDTPPVEEDIAPEAEELPIEDNNADAPEQEDAEEEAVKAEEKEPEIEAIEAPKKLKITKTHDELKELSHKELNDMLIEFGITVPSNSNKDVKIDALLRLNG